VKNFFIKPGYTSRLKPEYFMDNIQGVVHQPDVYLLARYLAEKFGSKTIIDIGCGNGKKLHNLARDYKIIGIDIGSNLDYCRTAYPDHTWIEHDLDSPVKIPISKADLANAVVICADVIEHLINPYYLLRNIKEIMLDAAVCLISTPERDLVRGVDDFGPPANPAHIREWNIQEFYQMLSYFYFNTEFVGLTVNNDRNLEKKTILGIIGNDNLDIRKDENFKVTAIMSVYNEEDVVFHTIKKLLDQDIHVYVIDNWSNDNSYHIIEQFYGHRCFLGVERFPQSGPAQHYNWTDILERIETLAMQLESDWFIHHDADEIRVPPWNVSLKEAIQYVDGMGFNAVDFTVINFHPLDNHFSTETDTLEGYFTHFEFGTRPGHFKQIKAWKKTPQKVQLARSGGHEAVFPGRKVCPYKFITKHYPVRSQIQGEKKIFRDRKPRWNPHEREKGWHFQYDHINQGDSFIRRKDDLIEYVSDDYFRIVHLVEMLSGIGIVQNNV